MLLNDDYTAAAPAGCRATYTDGMLTFTNQEFSCAWAATSGGLIPASWKIKGEEILAQTAGPDRQTAAVLRTFAAPLTVNGVPALHAIFTLPTPAGSIIYHFAIADNIPALTWEITRMDGRADSQTCSPDTGAKMHDAATASGLETDPGAEKENAAAGAAAGAINFVFAAPHMRLRAFNFADQTDIRDNLLRIDEYRLSPKEKICLPGVLFAVENMLPAANGDRPGLAFMKLAPLPHARPIPETADFLWEHPKAALAGENYPWTVIAYRGGQMELTAALQKTQLAWRPITAGRDGLALSNTWGDRHRDAALNEDFILKEIDTAAAIGIDVCQIDDGWQRGVTSNSSLAAAHGGGVWEGYYADDPNFWAVNLTRFPRGLAPLAEAAAKHNIGLGLWFSPDSSGDFKNWEKDAATVLALQKQFGVDWIKIDGVKSRTRTGEANLRRFFAAAAASGHGRLTFDLDVTAEIRPGYFGMPEFGPLFVENRYSDWHQWWPYATFRNLWQLAQALPPARLRMECLNPDRNAALYDGDPLAPANYSMDWIFFSVMAASPLLWCELSNLAPARQDELRRIIPLWKKYRTELHTGAAYPVGDCPDGSTISGFMIVSPDEKIYHWLLLRDCGADTALTMRPGNLPENARRIERLAGEGSWQTSAGSLTAVLPEKRSYLWLRYCCE